MTPSVIAFGPVSGFLSFIFESFVSQPGCLYRSGLRLLLLYLRIVCLPFVSHPARPWSCLRLSLLYLPTVCFPACPSLGSSGRVSGCLCFIFESCVSQPGCLWSGLRLSFFYLRIVCLLGASGRVSGCLCFIFKLFVFQPGRLWSGLYLRFISLPAWAPLVLSPAASALSSSHVSPSLWSGLRLAFLYLRIVCLPAWAPLVGSPAASALSSNHLSPSLGASGRVSACLCFIFESCESPSLNPLVAGFLSFIFESFVSQPGCLWSGLRLPLLCLRIICLPAWAPLVGPLSSIHLSPSLGASGPVSGCLCFIFESCVSQPLVGCPAFFPLSSNRLSPSLGASGRVSGCLCFIFE